jgi:hypothetical protein
MMYGTWIHALRERNDRSLFALTSSSGGQCSKAQLNTVSSKHASANRNFLLPITESITDRDTTIWPLQGDIFGELPVGKGLPKEAHARLSLGRTFADDDGWGRSWSPRSSC